MSTNSERSKLAKVATLTRDARRAEAAGSLVEAAALYQEVARLDPHDHRTLHRLAELHRTRLNRPRQAASWYEREARCHEQEGSHTCAIAIWRLVARCDPSRLEAYERIGALYVELARPADARQHYESAARELQAAGLAAEAAILRAQLAAIEPVEETPARQRGGNGRPAATHTAEVQGGTNTAEAKATEALPSAIGPSTPPVSVPTSLQDGDAPDADASSLAAERFQQARLFHQYGLLQQARGQLEGLLRSLPDHAEARQLLVEVCRALGDAPAAAQHLRTLTDLLRRQGQDAVPPSSDPWEMPPIEEWVPGEAVPEDSGRDLQSELLESVRDDLERVVEGLNRRANGK
jgi:tetratricopeptide (TPR) repeat protein